MPDPENTPEWCVLRDDLLEEAKEAIEREHKM
jgi:hypothetical protein